MAVGGTSDAVSWMAVLSQVQWSPFTGLAEVTLTVSDNGKGMAECQGMGLQNIRERTETFHGTLRIITNENEGTEINITLPL